MNKNANVSDNPAETEVLIKASADGDSKAFKQLYDSISGKMYSLCIRYLKDPEIANDGFQEGFMRLYKNLKNFRHEGSFEGWARRIFVNTCLDYLKKNQKNHVVVEEVEAEAVEINGIEKLDMLDIIKKIQQLPEGQRTVFNLYLIEGYTHKEIGKMLNISEGGSKSQYHRAKLFLKNLLEDEQQN